MIACDNNHGPAATHRVTATDGEQIKARNLCGHCTIRVVGRNEGRLRMAVEPIENWEKKIV
jgi:hypothetical protein